MRKFYQFAAMTAIAAFVASSFAACNDDETDKGPALPDVTVGTVDVSVDYRAKVTLTPSANAASISWGYAPGTAEPATYTLIEGNEPVTVQTPPLEPGKYTISAYAESKGGGKSNVASVSFDVMLGVPSLQLGEPTFDRKGIRVPLTFVGAEESIYYTYIKKTGDAEPAVPAEENFGSTKISLIEEGALLIPSDRLTDGTWYVFAYALNELGKSPVASASIAYDESSLPKLVEFEILNKTAYSLDVKVTMLDGCAKYVIGGYRNGAYLKASFASAARTSLNPDPSYPMQPYNWSERSETFPERLLIKNRLATSDESEGLDIVHSYNEGEITYQIAVYAVDQAGDGSVYVSDEFTVPAPAFGSTPTVKITAKTTVQTITPTYTVEGDCAKLYVGRTAPSWYDQIDWTDEQKVVEFLASIRGTGMYAYEGAPLTVEDTMIADPNTEFIVYAIPITADGKVGKLCYERFTTGVPEFDGTGRADIAFQTATENSLTFQVHLTGAESVRIICKNKYLLFEDELPMAFYDESKSKSWVGFTAEELRAANNSVTFENLTPDAVHFLRAVTIDAAGKMSPIQAFDDQSTLPEGGGEVTEIDFSKGRGEVKFNILKEEKTVDGTFVSIDLTYSVEKGANTAEAYKVILNDMKDDRAEIEAACKARLDPTDLPAPIAFGAELTQSSMSAYDPQWGGSAIAIVTKDTDGNFRIAHTYFAKAD